MNPFSVIGAVSAPHCTNNRNAVVGGIVGIYVDVDGATYLNEAEVYGTVTIPSSAAGILELTEDNRVRVIGAGRTVFSVTGLDGKTINIVVISGEAQNVFSLPSSTVSIETETFSGIPAQKVILPFRCMTIGNCVFANCPSLAVVVIPGTVNSIAADAFSGSLATVHCPVGSYAADWCAVNGVDCITE